MASDGELTVVAKRVADALITFRIDERARLTIPPIVVLMVRNLPLNIPKDCTPEIRTISEYYQQLMTEVYITMSQAKSGDSDSVRSLSNIYKLMQERMNQIS